MLLKMLRRAAFHWSGWWPRGTKQTYILSRRERKRGKNERYGFLS